MKRDGMTPDPDVVGSGGRDIASIYHHLGEGGVAEDPGNMDAAHPARRGQSIHGSQ